MQMGWGGRLRFWINRLRERLWVRPLMICLLSIVAVFSAGLADRWSFAQRVPDVHVQSVETLLSIISDSMLVMAVLAVGAMLAAYEAASSKATPRTFAVVLADDVSQMALSTFIGAFIFSIIALVALQNGYYEKAGRFALFVMTVLVFVMVILRFIRWVDRIARLGRMGTTIDKVEAAAAQALRLRKQAPTLGARAASSASGQAVVSTDVGYIQRIDIAALQQLAEQASVHIHVALLPGSFVTPERSLAYIDAHGQNLDAKIQTAAAKAFVIGDSRTFDEDPRFGLIVLSEIASRALSPAVNDPGTAIDIIGTLVRLFTLWERTETEIGSDHPVYPQVSVPTLSQRDMIDDAFNAISRDGAGTLEVAIRLQKALGTLAGMGNTGLAQAARQQSALALDYAVQKLVLPAEIERLRNCCSVQALTQAEGD